MRPKPVAYFLCAVSLLLIAVCPLMLQSDIEAAEAGPYKGVLTLWHITGWRAGTPSFEAYLRGRIRSFEAAYAYAFIELKSLTVTEAAEALAAGEAPDIISYPRGLDTGIALANLPGADTALPCESNSWPYACGGYCALINTDLLSDQGAEIPDAGWGIRPEALIAAAAFGTAFDAETGSSALPALALHGYPESDEPKLSTWNVPEPEAMLSLSSVQLENGLDTFLSGKCAVLIASHRQLAEAQKAYMDGDGPSFLSYAIGGYTDMVQMIGVAATEDEKKLAACTAFARVLLTGSSQRALESYGLLPAVAGVEIYAEDECRRTMYELLCEDPALPYGDEAQALDLLAAKALGGDAAAFKSLRAKLNA